MAGPNLELFKFGLYVFFPIATMYYFGHPDFYEKHVKGIKFWPEHTNHPPITKDDLRTEFAKLQAQQNFRKSATTSNEGSATTQQD
ncbi:6975_t:CDS:2 [Ambispora leptoticha]|uniref:6975_t:CDS:1 n=1 Tax=Ambispora leptoticha TaxID=144679 RepID=A0A9N8VRS5_9GLOM|nr:6975_t:CDS:2 [Ambispora leptoticha]